MKYLLLASLIGLALGASSCQETAVPADCETNRIYCDGQIARRCTDGFNYEDTDCGRFVGQVCSEGLGCRRYCTTSNASATMKAG